MSDLWNNVAFHCCEVKHVFTEHPKNAGKMNWHKDCFTVEHEHSQDNGKRCGTDEKQRKAHLHPCHRWHPLPETGTGLGCHRLVWERSTSHEKGEDGTQLQVLRFQELRLESG